jgi:hypothetical protein
MGVYATARNAGCRAHFYGAAKRQSASSFLVTRRESFDFIAALVAIGCGQG